MARARTPSRPSIRAGRSVRARPDRGLAPVAVSAVWRVPAAREIADAVTSLLPWAAASGVTAVPGVSIGTGGAAVAAPRGIRCPGGAARGPAGGRPSRRGDGPGDDVRARPRPG